MDAQEITFSIHTVITIIAALGSFLSTYHIMNGKIQLMKQTNAHQDEAIIVVHKRIDDLKSESVKNVNNLTEKYESINKGLNNLKVEIEKNKTDIINEIHKIKLKK